jgi:hypothetical protein
MALKPENLDDLSQTPEQCSRSMDTGAAVSGVRAGSTLPQTVQQETIEEISTDGAAAAGTTGVAAMEGDASESLLDEILERLALQDVEVRSCGGDAWIIGGVPVLLRSESLPGAPRSRTGMPQLHLLASTDKGRTWELFENVYRRHVAQAMATGAPFEGEPTHARMPPQRPGRNQQGFPSQERHQAAPPRASPHTGPPHAGPQQAPSRNASFAQYAHGRRDNPEAQPPSACDSRCHSGEDLPEWRSDGLPTFNQSFPPAFDARAGSSHYYNQFRVRVPSHYDGQ